MAFFQNLIHVARTNALPALALQSVAAGILISYYNLPWAHSALDEMAKWNDKAGLLFPFAASAFSGALLPFCFQSLQRGAHRRVTLGVLPIFILFWGSRGWLVDGLYKLQSALWGDGATWSTLLIKIACDIGIFSPILAIPSVALMFGWADCDFKWKCLRKDLDRTWYARRVLPLYLMAIVVWVPALLVIYALPQGLQFPVQAIIQCFWSLVLVVLTDRSSAAKSPLPIGETA